MLNLLNKLVVSLLILIPTTSFAMEEEVFKIKFSTQQVRVRKSDGMYAYSTWESAIPCQGLAEASAREGCRINIGGMCCSHAVVSALEYCHNRSDLLASYLHKAVTGGYDRGMNLEQAMNFVRDGGVMALPAGQTVKHGSGLSWPSGTRYRFSSVIDADTVAINEGSWYSPISYVHPSYYDDYPDKASRYRAILKKYNHPIVVDIHCGYVGRRDDAPFLRYRGSDDKYLSPITVHDSSRSDWQKTYHAIILYGFRESTQRFFVKNSWGIKSDLLEVGDRLLDNPINGLCTLPYDYFNKFARFAFVGLGHTHTNCWKGGGIYEGQSDYGILVEQIMKSAHRDLSSHINLPNYLNRLSTEEFDNLIKSIIRDYHKFYLSKKQLYILNNEIRLRDKESAKKGIWGIGPLDPKLTLSSYDVVSSYDGILSASDRMLDARTHCVTCHSSL